MKVRCKKCGHTEDSILDLVLRIIGGALPIGGFWAWTAYLFAGTGLAMPIVIAIILGGSGLLIFKDNIISWIVNSGYKCPKCGGGEWDA